MPQLLIIGFQAIIKMLLIKAPLSVWTVWGTGAIMFASYHMMVTFIMVLMQMEIWLYNDKCDSWRTWQSCDAAFVTISTLCKVDMKKHKRKKTTAVIYRT